ncbi:MAG: hypothetical protein EXR92_01065 [Gemmatimonadetes bacterium]|nr:hypothetical protein [Gemmatimonadota bacterium]
MILMCNFEEVTALTHGAHAYLSERVESSSRVAAPCETRGAVESLLSQLSGDLSVHTLSDQRQLCLALEAVVELLREEMDTRVLATHAASEEAVAAYFDFAHAFAVMGRVKEMGEEMSALVELMTGAPPANSMTRSFVFPD